MEEVSTPALATNCPHRDRPLRALGMCSPCYRAHNRAERLLRASGEARTEKAAREITDEWDRDPQLKAEFGKILWGWMRGAKIDPVYYEKDGRRFRDYAMELKLTDAAQRKADKAATVLGRAYVTEKVEEVKPQTLPIGANVDMSGWEIGADEGKEDPKEEGVMGDGEE